MAPIRKATPKTILAIPHSITPVLREMIKKTRDARANIETPHIADI